MYVPGVPRFAAFCFVACGLAVLVAGCGLGIYGTEDVDAAGPDAGLDGSADVALDTTADTTIDTAPDVTADTGPVADAADADAGIPCTTSSACKSSNQCVTGTCNMSTGTCVFTDATADSVCSSYMGNQAGFCDGVGHCVQCTKGSECPGTTTNCEAPACTSHACTTTLTPSGTPTTTDPSQVTGDCQTIECNGTGGTMSVADNADVPPSKDNGCQIGACSNGMPSYSNASNGTTCGTGLACLNGACSGCTMNSQCQPPAYDTCGGGGMANTCGCTPTTCAALGDTCGTPSNGCGGTLPCNDSKKDGNETDVDCGGNTATCTNRCAQGKKCNITADCATGLSCADGVCCNSACNTVCEACTKAKTGQPTGTDGVCQAVAAGVVDPRGVCTSSLASTCGDEGSLCNGSGACETWPSGTVCQAAACSTTTTVANAETCAGGACTSGGQTDCTPYKCAAGACTATCNLDTDCASGSDYCNALHQCTPRLTQGTACMAGGSPTQCQSGNCVDGFCCSSPCNTQCQACSNALTGGANGTCTNVNPGTADPSGTCTTQAPASCGTDGLCAALGACQDYASGSTCVNVGCTGGQQTTQGTCNGTGSCTGSTMSSCTPYICGATACLTSCPSNDPIGDGSCTTGNWCNGSACVAAQPSMSACTRDSQCSSGICGGDAGMMTCD